VQQDRHRSCCAGKFRTKIMLVMSFHPKFCIFHSCLKTFFSSLVIVKALFTLLYSIMFSEWSRLKIFNEFELTKIVNLNLNYFFENWKNVTKICIKYIKIQLNYIRLLATVRRKASTIGSSRTLGILTGAKTASWGSSGTRTCAALQQSLPIHWSNYVQCYLCWKTLNHLISNTLPFSEYMLL
jgi:hypothetical protein